MRQRSSKSLTNLGSPKPTVSSVCILAKGHSHRSSFDPAHSVPSLFTCTSNGSLRRAPLSGSGKAEYATLPSRLTDWKLNESGSHFVYGGDEVDISVWDTSLAFQTPETSEAQSASSKKRKRNELFPGEVWRAKNVGNIISPFIPLLIDI